MLGLVFKDRRRLELVSNLSIPILKKNEVLLKITQAGLSQIQVNEFVDGPFIIERKDQKRKKRSFIPGHEFGGIIKKIGKNAEKNLLNKQVAVLPLITCGNCFFCLADKEQLCSNSSYYGLYGANGGFANYCAVNRQNLFFVKEKIFLSFIEPLLITIHAAHKIIGNIEKNTNILIIGAGTLGICAAITWQKLFNLNITIIDKLPKREKQACEIGFKTKIEKNQKFSIVLDVAGKNHNSSFIAFEDAPKYIKRGGHIVILGSYSTPMAISPSSLLFNENIIKFSLFYNKIDVDFLKKNLKNLDPNIFQKLVTKISLKNIIESGYYKSEIEPNNFTRILVDEF